MQRGMRERTEKRGDEGEREKEGREEEQTNSEMRGDENEGGKRGRRRLDASQRGGA